MCEQWAPGVVGVPRPERALGAHDDELVRFAADLREVKKQAGSPTLRELARRAHYSLTTLSEATSGRKLPTLEVTLAYVRACGGDTAEWEQRWRNLAEGQHLTQPGDQPPYVGLAAFSTQDAERFHGRDRLVAELVGRVAGDRFTIVLGASGSGKTSLLRGGLVPALKMETVLLTPGTSPLEECAIQLARLADTTSEELRKDSRALERLAHQLPGELLVVVDQFEELFTACRDEDERAAFLALLTGATQAANSRCRVVLAVRADFHVHLVRRPELAEPLSHGHVLVPPMRPDELRAAITEPAIQAGCRVETTLLARILADSIGQPGATPFVCHALLETWRRRRGTTLTLTGYEAHGGIGTALAHAAETPMPGSPRTGGNAPVRSCSA
jgi:Helix-turn-helix domain